MFLSSPLPSPSGLGLDVLTNGALEITQSVIAQAKLWIAFVTAHPALMWVFVAGLGLLAYKIIHRLAMV